MPFSKTLTFWLIACRSLAYHAGTDSRKLHHFSGATFFISNIDNLDVANLRGGQRSNFGTSARGSLRFRADASNVRRRRLL